MSSRLYRDHFIRAFPSFDTATSGWAPQADVTWNHASPNRKFTFLKFPQRFMTEDEAIAYALNMAQRWIDRRNRQSHNPTVTTAPGQVIDMMETLKQRLEKAHPKQSRLTLVATNRRLEKILTFGEFKSAIAQSGLRSNEQTLQKSYAALDKLRNNKRLSWAETRRRVERLQQDCKAVQSPMRRLKAARIPLTERDWARIG
ncbi:MAG: hypothetical protein ACREQW_13855 [Candidatus Binatia bacterium]